MWPSGKLCYVDATARHVAVLEMGRRALPSASPACCPRVHASNPPCPAICRLALDQLAPAPLSAITLVSLSDSSAAASLALSLGCGAAEHLPARSTSPSQLQAWALQAVAGLAAARAPVRPLIVGYVMKEARQLALGQQGMLPLLPTPQPARPAAGGAGEEPPMLFVPLDLGSSLPPQLARCQLVLQKLTDCLQAGGGGAVAELAPEARALLVLLQQQQPGQQQQQQGLGQAMPPVAPVCLVDPAEAMQPVMDRAALLPCLERAALAVRQRAIPMRAPASLLLPRLDAAGTPRQLAAAGVGLPCIVKPQAACGVAEAHQMAFVLHTWVLAGREGGTKGWKRWRCHAGSSKPAGGACGAFSWRSSFPACQPPLPLRHSLPSTNVRPHLHP